MTSPRTDVEPSPVFVDQTGRRGKRLRGLGWVIGVVCVGFAVAMISGLLGTESQAPAFAVPAGADTTPPSQYVNAPLPSPPGVTGPTARTPAAGPTSATRPAATRTATRTGTAAGTAGAAPRTGTTAKATAKAATGTIAGGTTGKAGATGTAPRTGTALPTHTP